MKRFALPFIFAIGLLAILWVGAGFVGSSLLALAVTAVIGAVYLAGAQEIRRFRGATQALSAALTALAAPPASLEAWLDSLPASLRQSVRLRIEGERVALPSLALTPYLVGLLVMLGMLGTFLGMVVTFKGAVFALEGSTDLPTIRAALSAPLKGLGLSFGTSVAGVAASAMLGLMSAISRRERLEVARLLDSRIATALRAFSFTSQQQDTFRSLQRQADALPGIVDRLDAFLAQMEKRSEQLNTRLVEQQQQFHQDTNQAYTDLAQTVAVSLKDSLAASARLTGEGLRPVLQEAMTQIARESSQAHIQMAHAAQAQLEGLSQRFGAAADAVNQSWDAAVGHQRQANEKLVASLEQALAGFARTFEQRSTELLGDMSQTAARWQSELAQADQARMDAESRWSAQHAERMEQLAALWRSELAVLRDDEAARGQAAVARLGELQAALTGHLATLGTALEAPMARLMQTASEAPQAAAEVIAQLRQEMTRLTERDNQALQERTGLVRDINGLMQNLHEVTAAQRAAIETLVSSAAQVLDGAGQRFAQTLQAQAGKSDEMAASIGASALELASLGESFQHGVQLFGATHEKLIESLQQMDSALRQSMARSDEQLAYYVAQAREVIDLSISAQQGIVEDLRQLRPRQAAPAGGAG